LKKNIESLRVLAYHTVYDTTNFEKQLIYLKKNYSILSIDQLNNFLFKNISLPQNPLLITFDDGDISVFKNALPLLVKQKIPATLFVITNLLNTENPFWWDEIEYYLGKEDGNKKVWEVKDWKNIKREEFLINLRANSEKPLMKYPQLTISQLKEMQNSGISITNHSHTHPMFNMCTKDELEEELLKSINELKDNNFMSDIFAYPNGNYSELSEEVLLKNKIRMAFLFDHKITKDEINPLRISRLAVNDNTPMWKFKLILSGVHTKILPIIKKLSKLRAG